MNIAFTEAFLEDLTGLQPGLQRKCREMLSSLRKIEAEKLKEKALPGWRLHKLKSSPVFSVNSISLSDPKGQPAWIRGKAQSY